MKKFIFLYYGYVEHTEADYIAWSTWFASIRDHLVDSGNPFGHGKEINHDGTHDLPLKDNPISGYSIINAVDFDAAVRVASTCPFVDGIRVYEALSM